MEPITEATRLLDLTNNNTCKNRPQELSCSQAVENFFATIFSFGWYAWSHSQSFYQAVAANDLQTARFHLIKGAKVDLDNPNVKEVVADRASTLKTFLLVNARLGNALSTFQTLINQGDDQNAELLAKEAPISLASRIAIFDWATQEQGKAAQIANRILGTSARLLVRIAKAVETYTLSTLLPEIAQRESLCPFTRLYSPYPNELQITWENQKFVLTNYTWGSGEAPNMEQWISSLLRKAIIFGNIPLVRNQLDQMNSNEVPPIQYLLDATKNSTVEITAEMKSLLIDHKKAIWMGCPLF